MTLALSLFISIVTSVSHWRRDIIFQHIDGVISTPNTTSATLSSSSRVRWCQVSVSFKTIMKPQGQCDVFTVFVCPSALWCQYPANWRCNVDVQWHLRKTQRIGIIQQGHVPGSHLFRDGREVTLWESSGIHELLKFINIITSLSRISVAWSWRAVSPLRLRWLVAPSIMALVHCTNPQHHWQVTSPVMISASAKAIVLHRRSHPSSSQIPYSDHQRLRMDIIQCGQMWSSIRKCWGDFVWKYFFLSFILFPNLVCSDCIDFNIMIYALVELPVIFTIIMLNSYCCYAINDVSYLQVLWNHIIFFLIGVNILHSPVYSNSLAMLTCLPESMQWRWLQ